MTYDAVHVKSSRIDIRVSKELLDRVDARREELGQSRTKFIERALESALNEGPHVMPADSPRAEVPSAPSRAPAKLVPSDPPRVTSDRQRAAVRKPVEGELPKIAKRHWAP